MPRYALVWYADGSPRHVALTQARPVTIGRQPGSDVLIPGQTVSRQHANVRFDATGFVLTHLSATNPTLVNDAPVRGERRLVDGDRIQVGGAAIWFHDLPSADALRGPICPSCGRENDPGAHTCWYDGTAMVGASSVYDKRRVVARLTDAHGARHNIIEGFSLALLPGGALAQTRPGAPVDPSAIAVFAASDSAPTMKTPRRGVVMVNGEPVEE
ncbi:MAG: FHA domain-containing protein, partial [Dehalococcoidia bacterium]|nr:FHA domain-containing protein [Dehalococcoidia bacterium]